MTRHKVSKHIRITAMLLVFLLVPSVQAESSAGELHHRGVLKEGGDLWALRAAEVDAVQAPRLQVHAGEAFGYLFQTTVLGESNTQAPSEPEEIGSMENPLQGVSLTSLGSLAEFDIRVIPLEGGDNATFQAVVRGASVLNGMENVFLTREGKIRHVNQPDQSTEARSSEQSIARVRVDHPTVLTTMAGGSASAVVHGDFFIDILGLDVEIDSKNQDSETHKTGSWSTVVSESPQVSVTTNRLLRVIFHDATLTFQHVGTANRTLQWVTTDTVVEGDGGILKFQDPSNELLGLLGGETSTRFVDGYKATLTPDESNRFHVDLQNGASSITPTSTWTTPAGFNPLPLFLVLAAVALLAFGARRLRPTPELAQMESALEAGAFARAVRLASRILRKNPDDESARLGRAIALSRIGRPERVVKDLEAYLAHNEPSDGTMHYVLGLAYRDLGKEDTARSRLSQAVTLTPALAQQVPGAQPPPRNAPAGDAQGYT